MSDYVLNYRLLHPSKTATLAELSELWEHQRLTVRVIGMGGFIRCPSLLNKIRGGLGHVLLQSSSDSSKEDQDCGWSHVSPAVPLFASKPQINIGPYLVEITKPYRLTAQKDGQDLLVSINMFGFSKIWINVIKGALIFALRKFVSWDVLARDGSYFIPRSIQVLDSRLTAPPLQVIGRHEKNVTIIFRTPVDAERGNLSRRPQAIFERLFLRVFMLARWHDIQLVEQWDPLAELWNDLTYKFTCVDNETEYFTGGHKYKNKIYMPNELNIKGNMSDCIELLRFGENIGFGRGAVIGLGEFSVRMVS